ncbi:MAG: right-handed parallel beta-helix repeat-containing protein, partial [Candidatus Zixiibacteriota bacterium]
MKSQIAILTIILLTVSSQISYSTDVSGDVWGEWTATANPYNVVGDLRVPPGSTLVIGPGCYIEFQGYYQFLVDTSAVLQAIGTEIDSIIFTTADSTITWEGLCFLYSDSGSQLSYCRFERGNGVIESDYSYLEISNSLFQNNYGSGGAAYLRDNHYIIIENNYIRANRGFSAIYSARNSQVELSGNIFTNNDSMTIIMSAYNYDTLSVTENIFSENISCVIAEIDGRGISIENNFIYDNSAIMFICWQGSGPTLFRRNIIYDNYCPWSFAGGIFLTEDSYIIVENNTICNNSG